MLQRSWIAGCGIYNWGAGDDWCDDDHDWKMEQTGVHNIEEFDPDPFMDALNTWGLPWIESHNPVLVD